MRAGRLPVKWTWLPLRLAIGLFRPRQKILGFYFAGKVDSVGRKVDRFEPGQAVFGCAGLRMGAYAEYLCLPEKATLVTKPNNISFAEAAAVPLGGLNALHFMRKAAIQSGEAVLINGAGGSIGSHAVQIAKDMGATVTAVDAGHKEALLRELGADDFIDYAREDFSSRGASFDVVFSMVAGASYAKCLSVLRPGGRYLTANPTLLDMLRAPFTSRFTERKVRFAFAGETRGELEDLKQMIEAGQLRSIVQRTYPMEEAVEAHRRVEEEQRLGALVLEIQ
ncbi:MAG: NAD(P)-dependent alcohol dehydrogenase [Xanthomonadales bacterium]|nr:NAD(P)-dependent alcohol dehydrogenase [Xanthomonadales bacterium]